MAAECPQPPPTPGSQSPCLRAILRLPRPPSALPPAGPARGGRCHPFPPLLLVLISCSCRPGLAGTTTGGGEAGGELLVSGGRGHQLLSPHSPWPTLGHGAPRLPTGEVGQRRGNSLRVPRAEQKAGCKSQALLPPSCQAPPPHLVSLSCLSGPHLGGILPLSLIFVSLPSPLF